MTETFFSITRLVTMLIFITLSSNSYAKEYGVNTFIEGAKFSEVMSRVDDVTMKKYLAIWKNAFQKVNESDDASFESQLTFYRTSMYVTDSGSEYLDVKFSMRYGWFVSFTNFRSVLIAKSDTGHEFSESELLDDINNGVCLNADCTAKSNPVAIAFNYKLKNDPLIKDEMAVINKLSEALYVGTIEANRIFYDVKDGVATVQGSIDISEGNLNCRYATLDLLTGKVVKLVNSPNGCSYHEQFGPQSSH